MAEEVFLFGEGKNKQELATLLERVIPFKTIARFNFIEKPSINNGDFKNMKNVEFICFKCKTIEFFNEKPLYFLFANIFSELYTFFINISLDPIFDYIEDVCIYTGKGIEPAKIVIQSATMTLRHLRPTQEQLYLVLFEHLIDDLIYLIFDY